MFRNDRPNRQGPVRVVAMLATAPGNDASIGGLNVVTKQGWFATNSSGAEDVYKLYAKSLKGNEQPKKIQGEARALIGAVLTHLKLTPTLRCITLCITFAPLERTCGTQDCSP